LLYKGGPIFSLLINLILLPLRILAIPLKLLPVALGLAFLPLRILSKNLFLMIMVVAVLGIYILFKTSSGKLDNITPAPAPSEPTVVDMGKGPKNGRVVVEPVRKTEDGDSAFATDLYATMTEAERAYYSTIFFWAMSNLPDGQSHSWNNQNIAGTIKTNDTFQNKSGITCRHFAEGLKVHAIQQTLTGTACDSGGGTWCKLKPNATPACGLGHQPSVIEDLKRSLGF